MREVGTLFSQQEDEKKKKMKKMKMKRVVTSTSAVKTAQISYGGNIASNEGRRRPGSGKEGGIGIVFGNGHGFGYGYAGPKASATGNDLLPSSSSYVNTTNSGSDGNGNPRVRGGSSSMVSNLIHHSFNGVDAPKINISRGPNPLIIPMNNTAESAPAAPISSSTMGASAADMMMMMSDHDKDMNGHGSSGVKRWRDGQDVQLPQWGHGSKRTRCSRSLANTEAYMKPSASASTGSANNNNVSMAISSSSIPSASASPSPSPAEVAGKEEEEEEEEEEEREGEGEGEGGEREGGEREGGDGEGEEDYDEDAASKSVRLESRRRRRRPVTSNGGLARAKLRGYGGPLLPPPISSAPSKLNNAIACSKEGFVDRLRLSSSTAQISGEAPAVASDHVMFRKERPAQSTLPPPSKEKTPPKAPVIDKDRNQSNCNGISNSGNGQLGNGNGHLSNGNGHHSYTGPTIEASPEPIKPVVDVLSMEWPRIVLGLTRREKEDDFLAMKGTSKLPQRPKKRLKVIEKALHYCTPGYWLTDLSRGRYDVREKKCTKKKARGLKHMESADSDSDS